MRYSVIIPTYNRAADLCGTLESLATLHPDASWEVIVVDNNSHDNTRDVTEEAARRFPAELSYVFEEEQGRCAALNSGIRASRGEIILTTDDDVRFEPGWLEAAARA